MKVKPSRLIPRKFATNLNLLIDLVSCSTFKDQYEFMDSLAGTIESA